MKFRLSSRRAPFGRSSTVPTDSFADDRFFYSSRSGTVTAAASCSGAGQQMGAHNVFVYGSLQADDVVRILLKRVPQSSPAFLHD